LNWDDRPRSHSVDLRDFGVPDAPAYHWVDGWGEQAGTSSGPHIHLTAIPAHGVRLLSVRPATGKPVWMGDTLHVSQGQVVRAWRLKGRTLHARIGMGRPRRGRAWLWLPGEPLEATLDQVALSRRDLGGGAYAFDLQAQAESDLIIRW